MFSAADMTLVEGERHPKVNFGVRAEISDRETTYAAIQALLGEDEIIFDPGSTIHLFHSRDL